MSPFTTTSSGGRWPVASWRWCALLLAVLATGCGDDGGVAVDVTPPGPRVGFTTTLATAREGETAVLEVGLEFPAESPVTVNYTVGVDGDPSTDDADPSDHAGGGTGSVQIPAGAGSASIEITITDDDDIEPTREVLLITLQSSAGARSSLGGARSAVVLIEEGVCDRTPQLRDVIMSGAGVDGCSEIENRHLAGIERLTFEPYGGYQGAPLTTLRAGDFGGLSALISLNLSDNELTELPEGVFAGLTGLERLWISDNELTRLPEGVFADLSNLDYLRLNHNQLTELPENLFAGLTGLESWLLLHENQLTQLPAGIFTGLSRVEVLRLNGNRLTELPEGVFADLSSLTSLELGNNQLAELPDGVFEALASLTILDLRKNRLTTLHEDVFAGLASLTELYLFDNQLTELPAGLLTGLPRLAVLGLLSNPGSPFPLTLELRRTDSDNLLAPSPARISVVVAEGAPFPVDVRLSIVGGGLSQDTVTIATGDAASSEMTVTQTEGRQALTGIRVSRLPPVPDDIQGIRLLPGEPLLLFASASAGTPDSGPGGAGERREP